MSEPAAAAEAERVPFLQEKRILITAAIVLVADQLTKLLVSNTLRPDEEVIIIEGFLKFVNWHNTGAAWSQFQGKSLQLAVISVFALAALIHWRHHFEIHTRTGKLAMGMLIGGILGNFIDRLAYQHVVDFIRFHLVNRNGDILGYPAFNIADMGICIGVGLLFVMAWRQPEENAENKEAGDGNEGA